MEWFHARVFGKSNAESFRRQQWAIRAIMAQKSQAIQLVHGRHPTSVFLLNH